VFGGISGVLGLIVRTCLRSIITIPNTLLQMLFNPNLTDSEAMPMVVFTVTLNEF